MLTYWMDDGSSMIADEYLTIIVEDLDYMGSDDPERECVEEAFCEVINDNFTLTVKEEFADQWNKDAAATISPDDVLRLWKEQNKPLKELMKQLDIYMGNWE